MTVLAPILAADWQRLPDLPRPVSGQMVSVSNGALLVVGGTYFPKPLFEGGTKVWVDSVFILEKGARKWLTARLPVSTAYGGSVTTSRGGVIIGGGDARSNHRSVRRLSWSRGILHSENLPDLPLRLANLAAAELDGRIYAFGGQESPSATSASNLLWMLDDAGWHKMEALPAAGRILPVFVAHAGALYLFSGAELYAGPDGKATRRFLKDAWRYDPGVGWQSLPPVPQPVVAAPVISTPARILIFGGDDGENAPRIQELRDRHPGFSRRILAYDPTAGTWAEAGGYPAGLVTTAAVAWEGRLVVPGGEDRPGHRSPAVVAVPLEQLP